MKLKSCPFCGGESEILNFIGHGFVNYSVRCKKCFAEIPSVGSKEKAVIAWNTRRVFYERDLYEICFECLEICDEPEWSFYNKIMEAVREYEFEKTRLKLLERIDTSQYDTNIDF